LAAVVGNLLLLLGLIGYRAYAFLATSPSATESYRIIEIEEGSSYRAAVRLLEENGLVTNHLFFLLLGKVTQAERQIKPGEYALHTAMRPREVLDVLIRGKSLEYQVSIPEGYNARQIAQLLREERLADSEAFLRVVEDPANARAFGIDGPNLEGYLFPDTYYFPKRIKPEEIVKRMVSEFQTLWEEEIKQRADERGMSQREVVTLASIIEKETGQDEERRLISAVFHNRLKRKMRLQSDPTVIYPIQEFGGNITKKLLLTPTPYNTYQFAGLPPGPISSPGRESLLAAVDPAEVDYLYFVSKNNGTHYFSKTLADHSNAVNRYQKRRHKKAGKSGVSAPLKISREGTSEVLRVNRPQSD
jgi:UPF0755 protein